MKIMEDIINLECKYYLKNVKEDLNNIKLVDINTLKPYKISKNEEYFIKIDFKTIDKNDCKKILKKIWKEISECQTQRDIERL